jgi:PAS domain S-box-containing protein
MTDTAQCERRFRTAAVWLSAAVIATGGLVLAGWLLDVRVLKSIHPTWTTMKPNTALLLVVLGAAVWLLAVRRRPVVRRALGLIVALLAAGTVLEYTFGVYLGIDRLLVPISDGLQSPGRMAPQSAVMFFILGAAVVCEGWFAPSVVRAAGYVSLANALVESVGYLYRAVSFYEIGSYAALTLHTALGFLFASAALLAARPAAGLVRLLASPSAAGRIVRWLLPAIVLVPVITGWLQLVGESAGYYTHRYGNVLVTVSTIAFLGALAAVLATSLDRSERAVARSVGLLHETQERFRSARERQLHEMVAHAPHSIAMLDTELRYVHVSPRWLSDFQLPPDIIGKRHYDVFPEIPEHWRAIHQRCLEGGTATNDAEAFVRGDGRIQWVRWKACPWRDLEGRIGGILLYNEDITAQRTAEEAARITQEQLRLAQRVARIGTFDWNVVTGVNTWTPELEQMHGLSVGGFARTEAAWEQLLLPEDRAGAIRRVEEAFATGEPASAEWRVRWPDGSIHWIGARFQAFKDDGGRRLRLIGVNFDITETKQAEEQRERMLAEIRDLSKNLERRVEERTRELAIARDRLEHDIAERMRLEEEQSRRYAERALLLKEIHHRVKNNLQVISSLFYLQADRTPNETVRRLLDESRGRLQTIALIHDKLYRSEQLAYIDFGDYLRDLTATLTSAIGVQAPKVAVRINADQIFLDIDRALPSALIINELVTNSLRHGFAGERSGEVCIRVTQTDAALHLEVADDGIGFPDDLDFRHVTTLGLQLVTTLAEQMRGDIELVRRGGTTFRIHMPLPAATQSERARQSLHA